MDVSLNSFEFLLSSSDDFSFLFSEQTAIMIPRSSSSELFMKGDLYLFSNSFST